ncbi:prephenate dehydrogenase [Nocardioides daedukensis]|uniref:Prephenate dehydrogenase n=1 Tax=Nocardioides daedukensis TaxID=634462 RepID=A0A7Y9UT79_9ACTN|nr:prephenate dehydrogenase [Nocardioides daedukensis]NYG57494.1 prephenate dehydrogenase [Nocardioides daedukensis]
MPELSGPILVVGTGLLGTSVGLAARRAGIEVYLSDVNREHIRTASGLGAGVEHHGEPVQLVVVAVPPDHLGEAIIEALRSTEGVVTDVGSIKSQPLGEVRAAAPELVSRYVGSHPMAGSERSGPLAASASLFEGRPWAVTARPDTSPEDRSLVMALVEMCGAVAIELGPEEHDEAVARTSHLPHLMASLVAGRLAGAPGDHLALSGQGVRDVTRIAAGDPALWQQIISANRAAVLSLLDEVAGRLSDLRGAVADPSRTALGELLAEGVAGTRAIPGKHGGPTRPTQSIFVAVPDHPGELARLFADAGEIGVNIEDVHIDHDPGRPVGQVELVVEQARAGHLADSLSDRDWAVRE